MNRIPSDAEWTQGRVATLPHRWSRRLLHAWETGQKEDYHSANVALRDTTESLLKVRIALDSSDASLCEASKHLAERCFRLTDVYRAAEGLRAAMTRICDGQGINAPHEKTKNGPAISRMCCQLWWRRKLRKHQGQIVEAAAIQLGYVSKARDLYVSNERLAARQQQNKRNAATLEATIARNEFGQEFTLAELAAASTANKAIRRAELMTRIAGFERIARGHEHAGLFMTVTCPSRFHRHRTVNGGKTVILNPNYDPTENPKTGQKYLAKVWTHIRADLARQGISLYGIRIAEPQHDATPHWHLLVFCNADSVAAVRETVAKHALKDCPDEPGAAKHRCDFKNIDWTRGSAAGYIAKYVAKNIDGQFVGDDFNGKPAEESAARVDAWASTWGIRQFQQVGGPPVGVWRELRRIPKLPAGAPEHLRQAHDAANKVATLEGHEGASVAWDHYCMAQGGPGCGRNARIKLAMRFPEKMGIYGDQASAKPFGVETTVLESYQAPGSQEPSDVRAVHWIVESERRVWEIVGRNKPPALVGEAIAEQTQTDQPWTSVNNCTPRCKQIAFDHPFFSFVRPDEARHLASNILSAKLPKLAIEYPAYVDEYCVSPDKTTYPISSGSCDNWPSITR
jgi:hypothetical protein